MTLLPRRHFVSPPLAFSLSFAVDEGNLSPFFHVRFFMCQSPSSPRSTFFISFFLLANVRRRHSAVSQSLSHFLTVFACRWHRVCMSMEHWQYHRSIQDIANVRFLFVKKSSTSPIFSLHRSARESITNCAYVWLYFIWIRRIQGENQGWQISSRRMNLIHTFYDPAREELNDSCVFLTPFFFLFHLWSSHRQPPRTPSHQNNIH